MPQVSSLSFSFKETATFEFQACLALQRSDNECKFRTGPWFQNHLTQIMTWDLSDCHFLFLTSPQFNNQTRNNFLSQRSDKEGQHNIFLEPSPVKVHVVPTQVQLRKKLVLFVGHVFPGSPSFCSCWQWCAWNWLFPLFAEECGDVDHKHHLVEFLLIIKWGKSQPIFSVEGQLLQVKNL